jgi:N-acetylneuraminic acid mutarotase
MMPFSVNGKGYVGLGQSSNKIWQYDPVADAWKQMGNFPGTANTYTASFVVGNYAYVGTGDLNMATNTATASFYRYDPSTDTWTQKGDFPGGARNRATGFSIGNMGYLGTGLDIKGFNQISPYEATNVFFDLWQYQP